MNSCLEPWKEAIEPWIMEFWVGFQNLGLGFKERRTAEKRRKKKRMKMGNPGWKPFYTRVWVGSTQTRPTFFSFSAIDQDPDGSGSIQRSWSVSLIRTHQIRGYGPGFLLVFAFFHFFLNFLTICTFILATWTHAHVNFLAKILKKLPYVSWWICNCFVAISYFEVDKKHAR